MKIGILTLPLHTNYGGILQAYALQTVLERMGHEAWVIHKDYTPKFRMPLWKKPIVYSKRVFKKVFVDSRTEIFLERQRKSEYPVVKKNIDAFIKKNIKLLKVEKLSDLPENLFDAIVVGSDQVWRYKEIKNTLHEDAQDAYLDFAKSWKVRRIAYAVSFGVDQWEYPSTVTEKCKKLVSLFDAISVREDSGVRLCREYLNCDSIRVLDPTMLLTASDYCALFSGNQNNSNSKKRNTLAYYILDDSKYKRTIIDRIAKERNLTPFRVNENLFDIYAPLDERIKPPVENWLRGLYEADFIVTDSFHGCVFSIIFNKPFIAIGNSKRGLARFQSLLKTFGLMNNLIQADSDFSSCLSYSLPDNISEIMEKEKSKSLSFLNTFIS